MTWARRTDGNQSAIFATLRAVGWRVHDTSRLPGFVDGIAWHRGRGKFLLVECKMAGEPLTASQKQIAHDGWPLVVLRNIDEATRI